MAKTPWIWINIDEAYAAITASLVEEIDKCTPYFGTYDVVRSKVDMELKNMSTIKRKDRLVKKLKAKFGEGATEAKEEEDEEVEEDEDE